MEVYLVVGLWADGVYVTAHADEASATIAYATCRPCLEKRLELHDLEHKQVRVLRAFVDSST